MMEDTHPTGDFFVRVLDSVSPAAGAEVIDAGIVSIGLSLDHHETLSRIWLVVAAIMWLTLALLVPVRRSATAVAFWPT